jgi:hypothetical protein
MNLFSVFDVLKKKFTVIKKIEFKDLDLCIYLEPLTAAEEIRALEACKDVTQNAFISEFKKTALAYGIKQINDIDLRDDAMQFDTDDGKKVTKYIYFRDQIAKWPAVLRDSLFEGYNEMQKEAENRAQENIKFDRFVVKDPVEFSRAQKDVPTGFSKLAEIGPEITETEKMNKKAAEEVEQAQAEMDLKNMDASIK